MEVGALLSTARQEADSLAAELAELDALIDDDASIDAGEELAILGSLDTTNHVQTVPI